MISGPFASTAFRCTRCHSPALLGKDGVTCVECRSLYPFRNGSLDFMGPYHKVAFEDECAQRTVAVILDALSLPPEAVAPVTEAVASSYERTGISYIDAEIAALPSRFDVEVTGHHAAENEVFDHHSADVSFVRHYIPSKMARGTSVYRSARIRAGKVLGHTGSKGVGLSYTWEKADQGFLSGLLASVLSDRKAPVSYLPISVSAGTEITVPIRIEVPQKTGHYTLTLYPSGAGGDVTRIPIEVVDRLETIPLRPSCGDYGQDHTAAIGLLETFLTLRGPSKILEVASGVNPHLLALAMAGHEVIAGDVCSNQMQVGSIFAQFHHSEGAKQRLGYASFDAFNPPFQEESFDGVAMFAALHHFPDPVMFLQRLATLVKRTHPRRAALLRSEANWMLCLYGRQYRQRENRGFNDREAAAS